jgi:hypothetical protein
MVVDYFLVLGDARGHLWLRGWRCVNCGEVIEPGIVRHRRSQRSRGALLVERITRKSAKAGEVVTAGVWRKGFMKESVLRLTQD